MSHPSDLEIKRLKDAFRKEEEDRRKEAREADRKRAARRKAAERRLSKKPTLIATRDENADERLFRAIYRSFADGEKVILTAKSGVPVEDFRSRAYRRRYPSTMSRSDITRTYWTPHWDHTTDRLKALSWVMFMHERKALAMSMNLGDTVIGSLLSGGPGFATKMADRISLYLRRALAVEGLGVPPFFIWVEAAHRISPHVHGAILPPNEHTNTEELLRKALEGAAGEWKPQAKQNKVDLQGLYTPLRWVKYITKLENSTRLILGETNVVAAGGRLRGEARSWYEEARRSGKPIN